MRHIAQVKLEALEDSKQTFAHPNLHFPFRPHLHHFSILCTLHPSENVCVPLQATLSYLSAWQTCVPHKVPVLGLFACGNRAHLPEQASHVRGTTRKNIN